MRLLKVEGMNDVDRRFQMSCVDQTTTLDFRPIPMISQIRSKKYHSWLTNRVLNLSIMRTKDPKEMGEVNVV